MRHFSVTLHLVVPIEDDIEEDDLEEELAYATEQFASNAIMVDYQEEDRT